MTNKKGRPSKYSNPETLALLQDLVFLYKKENPSGIIRIADMVRFSKKMNTLNPDIYPAFSKDVWGEYGKGFIETANEPIRTKLSTDENVSVVLPNMTDLVQKYVGNPGKLLEYLLPIELMLHSSMDDVRKTQEINVEKDQTIVDLKEKVKVLKEVVKQYENFILTMSHDSYRKEHEGVLKNLISVNANERNKKAMRNVDNLASFFELSDSSSTQSEDNTNKEPSTALSHWKSLRNS